MTICPRFMPYIDVKGRSIGKNRIMHSIRYEKHSLKWLFDEIDEYYEDTKDEKKLGRIKYTEILDGIANGTIKAEELGMKM